jgi:SPP1 family predicted phage head-tail adaptor
MVKCCDISSGDLSERVTIERNTPTADGEGGFTDTWAADPAGGVWAKVRAVGGSERFFADRLQPGNRYRFVIRFRGQASNPGAPYYSADDRIVYNGREYGIESVVDVENRRRFLEIVAMENKAS